MDEGIVAIIIVSLLFVALPATILHYVTQWRKAGSLKPDDEHMIEDLWRSARAMERRIETLESILDAEAPGWRKGRGDAGPEREDPRR